MTSYGAVWVKVSVTDTAAASLDERALAPATAEQALIAALQAQNAFLLARVAELERRLGLNSSSGNLPSSDGLAAPVRIKSLRTRSGKPTGGQTGHLGRTLNQVPTPDHIIEHVPSQCGGRGAALAASADDTFIARQVFNLPEPQPLVVTEHRAHRCICTQCGAGTTAPFPACVSAPVQYGERIAAFVVYLMLDLFGVTLSRATIGQMATRAAARLSGFSEAVRNAILAAPVKHLDETGFRVGGRTQWLHIAATGLLTFYRVSSRRGSLLAGVHGIVVHGHWKPYYTMADVTHTLCNAHHLRELQALIDTEKEDWARRMQTLLRRALLLTQLARGAGRPLSASCIALIHRCYETRLAEGMAFHEAQTPLAVKRNLDGTPKRCRPPRRTSHNLLLRLDQRRADVLRFVTDPTVPFTNNQAERDGRMMKLRQKISGGFRSAQGAADFAILRRMIGTAKKQRWNLIRSIAETSDTLIDKFAQT